ncbi:MAG TPA: Calx-beta domain-containing protein, partial [Acidimicrobiia bacterium]|nr:Calx-beta domain-containing protein [Acidimicrobiia bacterium]
ALALLGGQVVAAQDAPGRPDQPGRSGQLSPALEARAQGRGAPPARGGLRSDGADNPEATGPGSTLEMPDGLLVQVFSDDLDGQQVSDLTDAGARIVALDEGTGIATVSAAPDELEAIATVDGVRYVREVLQPLTSRGDVVQPSCGAVHSEGDVQLDAIGLRNDWDVEGAGVEVGILSDTWNRSPDPNDGTDLNDDVESSDIPGAANPCPGTGRKTPVPVLQEYLGAEPIDEGRAMGQIVHDLAPAAELSFATAFNGETGFANNIRALRNQGADVIVDDVFYFNEPAFQNGPIGVAVEEVVADGAAYFSAIGNENETVNGHPVGSYETPGFRGTSCPAGITGTCHDFDPGLGEDATFRVRVAGGGLLRMTLKWNEPWNGVTTNLDLFYVVGGVVVGQAIENNPALSNQPFEILSYTATGGPVDVDVVVRKASGSSDPRFKLEHVRSAVADSEYQVSDGGDVMGPRSTGHSAAPSGVGVAAVPYNNANAVEGFSNHGPATWYWGPVGAQPATLLPEPIVLHKPDLGATDGVSTTFFYDRTAPFWPQAGTPAPRFYGTSAAAPHAAAVAALLLDCNPSLTPAQITATLQATAKTVSGGVPTNIGAGNIDARAAGAAVCLPPPPPPSFSVSDVSVAEGNGGFTANKVLAFTVTLSEALPTSSSVRYATANGTATTADYTAKSLTTLTFSAGQTSKAVNVTVRGDTVHEPDETMLLNLSSPVGAPVSDGQGIGTILDDDPAPVVPVVSIDDVSITEGNNIFGKNMTFTVRLSAPAPGPISIQYQTADGTAVQPGDYTRKGLTTLSFSKGQTAKTFTVTIKGDAVAEPDEWLFVLLSNPVGMTMGDGSAAGFILNDD